MLKDPENPRKDTIYVNELLSKQVANLFAQARLQVKKGLLYRTLLYRVMVDCRATIDYGRGPSDGLHRPPFTSRLASWRGLDCVRIEGRGPMIP